jgi:hypothetical protein
MFITFMIIACFAAALLGNTHALRDRGYTYPMIARRYTENVRRVVARR